MTTDLRSKIAEGFQASAYRGCTGELPPAEQDDKLQGPKTRFAQMISRKLEPFPIPKVGQAPLEFGTYSKSETINNRTLTNPLNCTSIQPPPAPDAFSKTGVVPNGLHNSRGFLETTTTQQRFAGRFDDDVMAAYNAGRERELALERERAELKAAPFQSTDPAGFIKSSSEHSNMSKVDRSDTVYKSRHNLGGANAASVRDKTAETIARGNAVDKEQLSKAVESQHESTLPTGYKKPVTDWTPTMKDHFCGFDGGKAQQANERFSTNPVRTANQTLSENDLELAKEAEARRSHRNDGTFETEHSATLKDRQADSEVDTTYRKSNVFDVKNRVPVMKRLHQPRADVVTGATYAPHEIVQGQYKSTSSFGFPARD